MVPAILAGIGGVASLASALIPKPAAQQVSTLTPEQQAMQSQFLKMAQGNMGGASSLMQALAMNPQSSFDMSGSTMRQNVIDPMNQQMMNDIAVSNQGLGMGGEMSSLGARALQSGIRSDYASKIGQANMQIEAQRMGALEQMLNRQASLAQAWGNIGAQAGGMGMQSAFDTVQPSNQVGNMLGGLGGTLLASGLSKLT